MHHHACRFVEHQKKFVLIKDIKADPFRFGSERFRFRRETEFNPVIRCNSSPGRIADGAVPCDRPLPDQVLQTAAGKIAAQLRQTLIQAHSGELLRDRQTQVVIFLPFFQLRHKRLPRIFRNKDRRKFRRGS